LWLFVEYNESSIFSDSDGARVGSFMWRQLVCIHLQLCVWLDSDALELS